MILLQRMVVFNDDKLHQMTPSGIDRDRLVVRTLTSRPCLFDQILGKSPIFGLVFSTDGLSSQYSTFWMVSLKSLRTSDHNLTLPRTQARVTNNFDVLDTENP
jgi:hypothetical protein